MKNKIDGVIYKGASKEKSCVVIEKALLQNKNLSWKARGILAYLLSLPDNWKLYVKELLSHSKNDSERSTRAGLNELIKFGYVYRRPVKCGDGKFKGQEYLVYEDPADNPFFLRKSSQMSVRNVESEKGNDPFFDDCELPTYEHTQYDTNRLFRDQVDDVQ